ncbi:hypothetical protein FMM74_012410 [Lachnospiraceae bacterium MD308]|nr:hypothetical protein [Lachnospiraceae bacterium MD308]
MFEPLVERELWERAEKICVGSCMEYRKIGRQGCTPHRIYEQDLHDAVLKGIREWAMSARLTVRKSSLSKFITVSSAVCRMGRANNNS